MRKFITCLLMVLIVCSVAPQTENTLAENDCNWTMYGGNPQRTGVAPDSCSPTFENDKTTRLMIRLHMMPLSSEYPSPVIVDDKIYLAENEMMVCLDLIKLDRMWSFKTGYTICSTPIYYDKKLIFGSSDKYVYCLDPQTGDEIWTYKARDPVKSSLLVSNGKVFSQDVTFNSFCLDVNSGEELWVGKINEGGKSSFALGNKDNIFIGKQGIMSKPNNFVCLSTDTGELKWGFTTRDTVSATPATTENMVVFGCEDGYIYCLEQTTGKLIWKTRTGDAVTTTPCIYKNRIYIGSQDGLFRCLDLQTGKLLWQFKGDSSWFSSATACDNRIYFCGEYCDLYILNADDGEIIYKGEKSELWRTYRSPPVIYDSTVYMSKSGGLMCFEDKGPPEAKTIEIIPRGTALEVSESLQFTTKVFDEEDNLIENATVTWGISNKELATINEGGLFTALSPGVCKVTARCGDAMKRVNVIIYEIDRKQCKISIVPESLFFGKIARGKEMVLPFILTIPEGIAGKLTPSEQWIEVSPSTFSATGKEIEGQVTIKGSALPAGESFEGFIDIIPDDPNCSPIKMKVIVKTDKSIQLKLVVGDSKARLNDETIQLDVPPQIINGRTLIPVRFISESFGCVVGWDASSGKITISRGDFSIVLFKDKKTAYINGEEFQLDVPATIVSGRTLVPVRFISEGFGAEVSWEGETKTITIDWNPF